MIKAETGEIDFRSGLHIAPHCHLRSLAFDPASHTKIKTHQLPLQNWKRHVLGFHISEHGTFEVEVLSSDEDRIQVVLLSHQHAFYEASTPNDTERRVFHEGVINSDLAGQKEFGWGEVFCRLEPDSNQDWLGIAYSREAKPLQATEAILYLSAHENIPKEDTSTSE